MLRLKLLYVALLAATAVPLRVFAQQEAIPAANDSRATEIDKRRLLRRISFGNRELNLPLQFHNDELQIKNDKLEIEISKLEDRRPDTGRLAIDQFVLEESREAVLVATSFARVWSRHGDPELQDQLIELDGKFDDANHKCHSRDEDHHGVPFETLEEAQVACSDLHAIYVAVSKRHIATPNGWPSVFKDDPGFKARIGFGFCSADTDQLKRDEASHVATQIKKQLIQQDQSLIQADKQIWLIEISSQDTVAFNARHPDHPMADENEVLDMMKKFRQDIADIGESFRNAVLKVHKRVQQKSRTQ